MFNKLGVFVSSVVVSLTKSVNDFKTGYTNATLKKVDGEQWVKAEVLKAEAKGNLLLLTISDGGNKYVATIRTDGQYQEAQLKKLGSLMLFLGLAPQCNIDQTVKAINEEAQGKKALFLLKGWKDGVYNNVIRVLSEDHQPKAKDESKAKAESKPKGKGKGKKVVDIDEAF